MNPAGPGLELVILTGFLGSGKTTLLRDFLAMPGCAGTGVIVNEAGEIGLDGALLREGADVPVTELANGCICCRMGSDLALTVDALLSAERPRASGPLRRIVLETSGLSKPGPILRQLAEIAHHRPRVLVLATYDALRGPASADFGEAMAQWAGAHRIVLTKADAVSAERLEEAAAEARAINPLAEIVTSGDRMSTVAEAFALSAPSSRGGEVSEATQGPAREPLGCFAPLAMTALEARLSVLLLRPTRALAFGELAAWLDNLAGALGERLLRLKGLVRVSDGEAPILVQSVGTTFSAPRPFRGGATASFLVVIARDAASAEIDAVAPAGLWTLKPWGEAPRGRRSAPARPRAVAV